MFLKIATIAVLFSSLFSHAGTQSTHESPDYFQRRNLIGKDFGLERKEIVLTFDDGPGPQTLRLIKVLKAHNVPATFFFLGSMINKFPNIARESLKIISENPDLFSVANHTDSHSNLYELWKKENGQNLVGRELVRAHEVIRDSNPKDYTFFRAPYGNFSKSMADMLNTHSSYADLSENYVGPVFWDMGGFYDSRFSAGKYVGDWTCWAKPLRTKIVEANLDPVKFCADGHFKELLRLGGNEQRKSGIILLAHDFHVSTVNMFIGATDVNEKGELVNEDKSSLLYRIFNLKDDGYRFVGLDKSLDHIENLLMLPQ